MVVQYCFALVYFSHSHSDIDECARADTNDCSQSCTNAGCLDGRYTCSCNISGYILGSDDHTCIGKLWKQCNFFCCQV